MKKVFAFLDTNSFLHYVGIDQIDWLSVLSAEKLVILVAPVVVRELDIQKDTNPVSKLRKRAASALRRLDEFAGGEVPAYILESVELEFLSHEPSIDFTYNKLSPAVQDDQLLASVIEFRGSHSADDIVLVTSDVGIKIKARQHQVRTFTLPDGYKLPEETDPLEKRNKELEDQIRSYKNAAPDLCLAFGDGLEYTHFRVLPPTPLSPDEITRKVKEERMKRPHLVRRSTAPSGVALDLCIGVTQQQAQEYNSRLDAYYTRFGQYLREKEVFDGVRGRTIALNLKIENRGSSPAEDIDVFLHFPDGFDLLEESQLPKPPKPPDPPRVPQTPILEAMAGLSMTAASILRPPLLSQFPITPVASNVSGPYVKRSKSYDVDFHVRRLKHKMAEAFDTLYVLFPSFEEAISFRIDYRINAGNLPEESLGGLHVIVGCG